MKLGFAPLLITKLVCGQLGVVELLAGRDQMEDDQTQLVCCRGDCLRWAELSPHPAVEIAKCAMRGSRGSFVLQRHGWERCDERRSQLLESLE